jgi:hypothetical protein
VFTLQLLAHDVAVATVLSEPIGKPVPVRGKPARALWGLIGLPATLAQVAAHRVAAAVLAPTEN